MSSVREKDLEEQRAVHPAVGHMAEKELEEQGCSWVAAVDPDVGFGVAAIDLVDWRIKAAGKTGLASCIFFFL